MKLKRIEKYRQLIEKMSENPDKHILKWLGIEPKEIRGRISKNPDQRKIILDQLRKQLKKELVRRRNGVIRVVKFSQIQRHIEKAEKLAKKNKIIIYDFDDTIGATTGVREFLIKFNAANGLKMDPKEVEDFEKKIKDVDINSAKLIKLSCELGIVYIVTNATKWWIETSCKTYYPLLWAELSKVAGIVSAQDKFAAAHPLTPATPRAMIKWKELAFREILKEEGCFGKSAKSKNIISIGDSTIERDAMIAIMPQLRGLVKLVKLPDKPTISSLAKTIEIMEASLAAIVKHGAMLNGNLDDICDKLLEQVALG